MMIVTSAFFPPLTLFRVYPIWNVTDTTGEKTGEKTGSQRKLFQETTMFLVYGALVKENQPLTRHAEPIISFFAYPLVDQASLMDHILLNTRSLDRMKQDADKAAVEPARVVEDFVSYDDPVVDSIMNGCDSEQESGYSSDRAARGGMDLDEGMSTSTVGLCPRFFCRCGYASACKIWR